MIKFNKTGKKNFDHLMLFLSLFFFINMPSISHAVPLQFDSTIISHRKFDINKITKLKAEKKYDYGKEAKEENLNPSYFAKLINRIIEAIINVIFGSWKALSPISIVIRIIIYILFFGFIIYVLYQVFNLRTVFGRRKTTLPLNFDIEKENIHELDFNKLLHDALINKQYRYAIRLHYLQTLKKLSEQNYIQWGIDKTNRQYIQELKEYYKPNFISLSKIFEWVWYGERLIDEEEYTFIEKQFDNFNKSIR